MVNRIFINFIHPLFIERIAIAFSFLSNGESPQLFPYKRKTDCISLLNTITYSSFFKKEKSFREELGKNELRVTTEKGREPKRSPPKIAPLYHKRSLAITATYSRA